MAQVTIYMNNNLESHIKQTAASLNISISKYISNILQQNTHNEWNSNTKKLSGSWDDFSSIEEIRDHEVADIKRESF